MSDPVADKRAAFRQLANEHLDASYGLASAILRDPVEAQDAVHDAFVTAWRRWETLREPARFQWWFRRILVNTCRDRLRRLTRHPTTTLPDEPVVSVGDSSGMVNDHAVLDRAFAVLSADDKVVLILGPEDAGYHFQSTLTGHGAHEGLTAILTGDQAYYGAPFEIEGVVIEGPLPPLPEPADEIE